MSQSLKRPRSQPRRILAGDIGATHSRLAIYNHDRDGVQMLRQQTYPSGQHACLSEVLASFLATDQQDVEAACLGLPGPVRAGSVVPLTNLPWTVDWRQVRAAVGTDRVALINDVQAAAAGIPHLCGNELTCLHEGQADPTGNRVVVSVGTGLGVSALTATGQTFATEAGHATFAPRRKIDFDLQSALTSELGHVSWERVASGFALPWIHAVHAGHRAPRLEGPEIVRRTQLDPVCRDAVETMRRYIGAVAGDIALMLMASGGLFISGGVATKVIKGAKDDILLDAFLDKGRMRPLLERVPVYLVDENDLALRGAAQSAVAILESSWS